MDFSCDGTNLPCLTYRDRFSHLLLPFVYSVNFVLVEAYEEKCSLTWLCGWETAELCGLTQTIIAQR